jgi:REP element-mobilizing transposase RayT
MDRPCYQGSSPTLTQAWQGSKGARPLGVTPRHAKGPGPFAGAKQARRPARDNVSRAPRVVVPGEVVHVVARGVLQQAIYRDDRDRTRFSSLLREVAKRYGWRCLTYCLLGNHFHLVIQVGESGLSDGMHDLNGFYARWHNERHERTGHLFERRFWSKVVRSEAHMIGLSRYVALNPVRAGLCSHPAQWPWSAHGALVGVDPPGFVDVEAMLAHFGADLIVARARYEGAVTAVLAPMNRPATNPRLLEILAWAEVDAAVVYAHDELGYATGAIARVLGCRRDTVTRRLHRGRARAKGPGPLA